MLPAVIVARPWLRHTGSNDMRACGPPRDGRMPAQAKRVAANKAAKSPSRPRLGALPVWNLADLYAGIDDPAVKRDLDRADAYSMAFEEDYKGKLAALAEGPDAGPGLAEAVKRYEQLDDQ